MECALKIEQKARSILSKIGKYKYTALILLLGIVLMLIPQREKVQDERPVEQSSERETEEIALEDRLEQILSHMDGVGKVEVLLTLETGTAYQYQTDIQTHTKETDSEVQKETVLASDGSGRQVPITVRTTYPTYQGALVLCQGADSAAVRLDVINAVSDLTGLGSDKISVIKMKDD